MVAIFIGQMLRGERPTVFGDGSKTRDYVYVEDVVAANLLALERCICGVFNIGRGIQVSDYEIFEVIRERLGIMIQPIFAPQRLGEVEHISLDAGAAARAMGWNPNVGLVEGIEKTIASIRSEVDLNALLYKSESADAHFIRPGVSVSQS